MVVSRHLQAHCVAAAEQDRGWPGMYAARPVQVAGDVSQNPVSPGEAELAVAMAGSSAHRVPVCGL